MKLKKAAYSYVMMLGHLCADLGGGALPAILPFLMVQRGLTYTQSAGLTFALSSVGSIIQPLFGSMADKTSRPWLMSLGILMAGCDDLMYKFIEANPGLRSRFNKYLHFPDYTGEEMEQIFQMQCKKNGYLLAEDAQTLLREEFDRMYAERDDNFGNGRTVRNAFEKIINCQANRLAADQQLGGETPDGAAPAGESLADEVLMTLTEADVREGMDLL